ncbi:hypothetical protein HanXRQr2_Chr04g0163021 [Helianthus annuus]|uniref:Uncharacterized protein n=1 Tax=Helianthus annuus TaxID=4232 RepID=A0A9K3J810_HELAN|nr:hypothetical protein HanXRQr2_Chr04g0163021 [Helianthus annuus]KAJ0931069.1 hypothetical protein HanPSC8_Chr04g0157101 [Helianthus annuus]
MCLNSILGAEITWRLHIYRVSPRFPSDTVLAALSSSLSSL